MALSHEGDALIALQTRMPGRCRVLKHGLPGDSFFQKGTLWGTSFSTHKVLRCFAVCRLKWI